MAPKNNYKTKWLQALEEARGDVVNTADVKVALVQDTSREATDAALALKQTRSMVNELAHVCEAVVDECDESRHVGGLEFCETRHAVDLQLPKMSTIVALRRVRDVLRIAEARIAILSLHCEDQYLSIKKYESTVDSLLTTKSQINRTLLETHYIGRSPTESELEDYNDDSSSFARFGIKYEDVDDEWIDNMLTKNTVLRTKAPIADDSDEDDADDVDPEDKADMALAQFSRNRKATVQPASPGYLKRDL